MRSRERFFEKNGCIVGRFYDLKIGRVIPERNLCTIAELARKRTETSKNRFLTDLYAKKLKELLTKKESTPAKEKKEKSEADTKTLDEAIRLFTEQMPRTKHYTCMVNLHLKFWSGKIGAKKLRAIKPAMIVKYRDELKTRIAPPTVNHYLNSLSVVFEYIVKDKFWLENNPVRSVRKLSKSRNILRFLSEDELQRLLSSIHDEGPALELAVILSLATGARQAEIWGLAWENVNLESGVITFTKTKNKEIRSGFATGHALKLLRDWAASSQSPTLVFPSTINANKSFDFRLPFLRAKQAAGLKKFRWHDLRHSCASFLAMDGTPLLTIATILGHKTLEMTKRYAHLSPENVKKTSTRLDNLLFSKQTESRLKK